MKPLRVLILEDSELDATLMLRRLRDAGFEPDWQRVTNEQEFRAALSPTLDVILADYSLPGWDALAALAVLRESKLDVPLIIVTGSVSEEVAVACMREGASDYLLKDRLGRLGASVSQALEKRRFQRERADFERALLRAAEAWRQTFDAITDIIIVFDSEFRISRANRAAIEALGITFPEILERHCYDLFQHLDDLAQERSLDRMLERMGSEGTVVWEPAFNKWLQTKINPLRDDEGNLVGAVNVMRDISPLVEAEQALRESEERYRNLVDTSLVGAYIIQDDVLKFANRGLAAILGYPSPADLEGMTLGELIHPDDYPIASMELASDLDSGGRIRFRGRRADGTSVFLEALGRRVDFKGKPAVHGFVIDVTAQVMAENEREIRNRQQAVVVQFGQVALAGMSLSSLFDMAAKTVSDTLGVEFAKILQWRPEQQDFLLVSGVGWDKAVIGTTTITGGAQYQAGFTLQQRSPVIMHDYSRETRFERAPLLAEHDVQSGVSVLIMGAGAEPFGVLGAHSAQVREFTEDDIHFLQAIANILAEAIRQQQARQALVASERELSVRNEVARALLTSSEEAIYEAILAVITRAFASPVGMVGYIDVDGSFVAGALSEATRAMLPADTGELRFPRDEWSGFWKEVLDEHKLQILDKIELPPSHISIHQAMMAPILYQGQLLGALVLANRAEPYTEDDLALLGSLSDYIAPVLHAQRERRKEEQERKRLQEQYQQMQRLEAIGQLTTGIAHDFNNMLTPVISLAELLRMRTPETDRNYEVIENIIAAGKRAADLVKQLLAFSRKQVVRPEVLDVAKVLEESQKVLQRVLSEDISLSIVALPGRDYVEIDPTQVQQILFNLVLNARDAMPNGGELRISVDDVEISAEEAATLSDVQPGAYVRLQVSDTGHGIPPDVREHIFEPFYTTKQRGRGTGLGLASVYGIVKQNHGDIVVDSEVDKGTTFTIYLPRVEAPPTPRQQAAELDLGWLRGDETILLVEDDPNVRQVAVTTLKQLGYRVLEATDGADALHIATTYPQTIHLMLSDVIMPGIDGTVLAQEIRRYRPDMKIIFMSGYPIDVIDKRGADFTNVNFIHKPFSPQTLAKHIRSVLEEPASS